MDTTARLALPLLQPGQAQKEIWHNEALALLDLLVQPAAVATAATTPPAAPVAGQCWVLGAAPAGAWSGQAQAVAGWTAGGWRFAPAVEGMTLWVGGSAGFVRFADGAWTAGALRGSTLTLAGDQVVGARQPAIAGPGGGGTTDAAARTAIEAILTVLRTHGLIAS